MQGNWKWWSGRSDEWFDNGPFDTREEAIAALEGAGGNIIEARMDPISLSQTIDVDLILEHAEDCFEHSENMDCLFDVSQQQMEDLRRRLQEACDQWQRENGLVFQSDLFSATRSAEYLDADPA